MQSLRRLRQKAPRELVKLRKGIVLAMGTSTVIQGNQVKVITSLAEMRALRPFWEIAQRHPSVDIDFFELVVKVRSNVVSPCVLALFRDEKPAALLPGRIEEAKFPIRLGYATLAGIPVRQVVLLAGEYMGEKTEENCRSLLKCVDRLLREQRLDLAIFWQLKVGSYEHEAIQQTFKQSQFSTAQDASKHWLMSLPGTWDDFLRSRSHKRRHELRRLPRVLDRDFAGQWKIKIYASSHEAMEFINAVESVAGRTYQRGLNVGFRRDEENVQRIHTDARQGRLAGYVLFIKDKPTAFWYCFDYKGVLYPAATGYDPAFRDYELGTILLLEIIHDYCGTDIGTIDFGSGDADYKRRFCSDHFLENSLFVFSRSARGRCLHGLHRATGFGTKIAKQCLDRLQITQQVKTRWRRRLEPK